MKFERNPVVPAFEPITITIESLEELKWITAIANTCESAARSQGEHLGFDIERSTRAQMNLWDGLTQYTDLIKNDH